MSESVSADKLVQLFGLLSDPTRLEIARLLVTSQEVACTFLQDRLGLAKSTISYHIRIFKSAGLISIRKDGTFFHYRLVSEGWNELLPGLVDHLAKLDADEFTPVGI